jgi:peptide/nickel transport system permease protein
VSAVPSRRRVASWTLATLALTAIAIGVIVVPLAASRDPLLIQDVLSRRLVPPLGRDAGGAWHLLGTDRFGRDLFVRMMLAGRLSLMVGVLGAGLSGIAGTLLGAIAGWRANGIVDRTVTAVADVLLALPRLVLLLVGVALWQPGISTILAVLVLTGWMGVARLVRAEVRAVRERPYVPAAQALGASQARVLLLVGVALWQPGISTILAVLVLTGWMGVARLVRAEVRAVRERPYVPAAQALGASQARVLLRHVLPNAVGPAVVATTLGVGNAILLESGLSFLGLGIQPPAPSWGNMIAGGRDLLVVAPWVSLAPGIALVVTVLATTVLGDAWRDRLAGELDGATRR